MINKYILEFLFIIVGVLFFSNNILDDFKYKPSETDYFLSQSTNYKNSKRDFSIGVSDRLGVEQSKDSEIPVLNVTVDEADFFDFESGIYTLGSNWHNSSIFRYTPWWRKLANYKNRGGLSARLVDVTLFETTPITLSTKIKINGNNTRAYQQKSLRIKDNGLFQKALFSEKSSDWLILRNSGNDWDKTMFSDAFCSEITSSLNVYSSKSSPVFLYLNKTFWGLYNSRQRIDEDFISSKHNINVSKVLLFENNGAVKYGGDKSIKFFKKFNKIIDSKNSSQIEKILDIENFIDYIIAETYFNNVDWPNNNVLFYKIDSKNSKWKFIPKDFDFSMSYTSNKAFKNNPFGRLLRKNNSVVGRLFSLLIKENWFKTKLTNRVEFVFKNDFSKEKLLNQFDLFSLKYGSVIQIQIDRWRYPRTKTRWVENVSYNRIFLEKREEYYLKFVKLL